MKAVLIAAILCLVVFGEAGWGVDASEYIKRKLSLVFVYGIEVFPVEKKPLLHGFKITVWAMMIQPVK